MSLLLGGDLAGVGGNQFSDSAAHVACQLALDEAAVEADTSDYHHN